jgi:exopolysaccharide biosynthesis predicted pyruvyltransferase EpsI
MKPLPIEEYLADLQDEELIYVPNPGNGGDSLIALAAFRIFHDLRLNVSIADSDTELTNRVVLYAGGGSLVNEYGHAAQKLSRLHKKVKKLIILPHTINAYTDLISEFGENVDILCRELSTLDYVLSTVRKANVFLVHDLAFSLDVQGILRDRDLLDRQLQQDLRLRMGKKFYIADLSKRLFQKSERELVCFRQDVEQTSIPRPPENVDLSIRVNYDHSQSDPHLVAKTVFNILFFMNGYARIVTNRLHLGIAGALLGKAVELYPNSYNKNESIYRFSMQQRFPNVRWVKE